MYQLLAFLAQLSTGCVDDFDRLVAKTEQNYAGFELEVRRADRTRYDQHRDRARARAAGAAGDDCYFALKDYIDYFHDPHLFIFQSTRLDSVETARRRGSTASIPVSETEVRRLLSGGGNLDPLEGIWSDGTLRVGILGPSRRPGARMADSSPELIGFVLTSDTSIWPMNAIRARFTPRADGGYDGMLWERNYAWRVVDARVHKRVLLRFSPGMWRKEFPIARPDSDLVSPVDPHRATIRIGNRTVLLSIPSHDPTYRAALDSLIDRHADALRTAERLIVDLRGNEGGSSGMTNRLLPYILSREPRSSPLPDGQALMLSSEDQIRYVQRFMVYGPDTLPGVQRLLARLRANPGRLVPLEDSLDTAQPARPDSIIVGPRRVGILIDGGTVSAAEAFLLKAMRSTRVTVFGENSGGALDYQSVSIVQFQVERPGRWLLGYPTIAASADLPRGGIKGKGIAPHVRLNLNQEIDVVATVDRLLRRPE